MMVAIQHGETAGVSKKVNDEETNTMEEKMQMLCMVILPVTSI